MKSNEELFEESVTEYKEMINRQDIQNQEYQKGRMAPHIIHKAKIEKDGDMWCCILGEMPTGVSGFGKTPKEACEEFDIIWNYGDTDNSNNIICSGCEWIGVRHQKCSCCVRNKVMKDNYKES